MRRFIYGTTWRTAQAARAADDVAARQPAGATVQRRDATGDGRPPGKDRSVVLIVAVFDGEQSAAPGGDAFGATLTTTRRRCGCAGCT